MWAVQRGEALTEPDFGESDDNHLLLPVYEDRGDGEEYVRMPIPYATLHTLDGKNFFDPRTRRAQGAGAVLRLPHMRRLPVDLRQAGGLGAKLPQLELHPVFSSESNAKTASVPREHYPH